MVVGDRKPRTVLLRETPEEAMDGIASAIEFLRREVEAIGMHDVGELIGRVRARLGDYRPPAGRTANRH